MGDLEEYSDEELMREMNRRNQLRIQGLCSYCRTPFSSGLPCRFHEKYEGDVMQHIRRILVKRHDL